jgi:hypothetical protein
MFWATDGEHSHKVYYEKELADAVFNTIKWYKERNREIAAHNEKLHDDAASVVRAEYEAEIAHLKERLSMSYGQFASQKEKDAYDDFERRHMHERLTMKIQGGKAPYLIPTGTGIGTHLEVVCPICGEKEDITDLDMW